MVVEVDIEHEEESQSLVRFHDLWLAKDNRFLNPFVLRKEQGLVAVC